MTDRASHQEIGRRIEALLERRGLTHEALAERVGVDVGTVGRWVRGEQQIRSRNLAKVADALDVELYELRSAAPQPTAAPGTGHSGRDLRTVDFVTWLADNSDEDFADLYQAVADRADQIEARPTASRHSKSYTRAKVSRQDLTDAVADYYDLSHEGAHLY
ncbi:MAG: helix-turn-helix transcriptional regulator, partial [Acidimicrobiales bacterium]